MSTPRAGVLALQGAVTPHLRAFERLGVPVVEVRRRGDLATLTHLVLPGGESTTMHHLLELFELRRDIVDRHRDGSLVLFGVCAGVVLLGRTEDDRPPGLGLLDVTVRRNAYGRQVHSCRRTIRLEAPDRELLAVYIRAPRIVSTGRGVRVLATDGGDPVLVEGKGVLAATFHPELSGRDLLHRRFLAMGPAAAAVSEKSI